MAAARRRHVARPAPPARDARFDEGAIHDWHRRLRAEVLWRRWTSGDAVPPPGPTSLRDLVGDVRDIDAAAGELERGARKDAPRGSGPAVRRELRSLRAEAARRRDRLRRAVRADPGQATQRTGPPPRLPPEMWERARSELLARVRRAQRRAVDRPSRRRLHRVRKRIRELGLLAEVVEATHPTGTPRLGPELRRMMQDLGRSNDRAVLIRWIGRRSPGSGTDGLLRALRNTQRERRRATAIRLGRVRSSDWASWSSPRVRKPSGRR